MKKKLLTLNIAALILSWAVEVTAQTAASAVWPLNTKATNPSVPEGASGRRVEFTGAISAENQILGGLNDATYSTSLGQTTGGNYQISGGWQRLTSTQTYTATSTATPPVTSASLPFVTPGIPDYTHYTEFKVTPNANTNLNVTEFKISALGGGTSNGRAVILYSLDGFATPGIAMPVAGAYYNTTTAASATYAGTEAAPVTLINSGSQFTTSIGGPPNGIEKLTFGNMNITVAPTQTFSVRIYPFLSTASPTSARYFASQQASITGTTTPVTTNPLDFLSFTAKSNISNQIKLDWKTTNEVNTKNFVVERSNGATGFAAIGTVNSQNTAGEHSYSFVDNAPLVGTNYYRLIQVDLDGSSKYSATVSAEGKAGVAVKVYPNPASGSSVTVSYPASDLAGSVKVITLSGNQVAKVAVEAGSTNANVDISGLAAGYYVVVYTNGKSESSTKFVKQ